MAKNILIDLSKCIGCFDCFVACRDEHCGNDWTPIAAPQPDSGQFWVNVQEIERGSGDKLKVSRIVTPCMHCDNPPCVKAATNGGVYKRSDGIVIIDPEKSIGQQQIIASCPYGVIYWNSAQNIPQKCTMCAHLLDAGWTEPRCVNACPTGTLQYGEYSALQATITSGGYSAFHPEYGTQPRVLYINLPKTFIAGSVLDNTTKQSIKGATITLTNTSTNATLTATSNIFGDFWFDGLDAKTTFKVTVAYTGKTSQSITVTTNTDQNLGDIAL